MATSPPPDRPNPTRLGRSADRRAHDRQIIALALPALGTLIAEPAFVVADTAIVARLGTDSLAGLTLGATVIATVIGLCIFLAYGTTATTARLFGAGDTKAGIEAGIDGLWLALGLGVVVAVILAWTSPGLIGALGGRGPVAEEALSYLHASLPGLPFMLVSLAATGVLRGLLDTRTPLLVTTVGLAANGILNAVLVFPAGLGIAGSGLGTSIAQTIMGVALATVVLRQARRHGAEIGVRLPGIATTAVAGVPLVVRSLAMRATLLLAAVVVARQGSVALASHQVILSLWSFTAFALDAIAIAGQALTGRAMGRSTTTPGDDAELLHVVRRMTHWGWAFGAALGGGLILGQPLWRILFDSTDEVSHATLPALAVVAAALPLAGFVFVVDGILIGAGDGRYLGKTAVINTLTFLPLAWAATLPATAAATLLAIWLALAWGWMGSRAITLHRRLRSRAWIR